MELKPGYKQTEVGLIPVEWSHATIRGIASRARNAIVGGPFGSDLVSLDYVEHGVPVIRGQNMSGQWVSGTFAFVTSEKAKSLEANLAHPGDIVFTQRGTLGQVSLVPEEPFESYLVSQSQMKLSVNPEVANPLFFFYVFTSEPQQQRVRGGTIQTGVPHINLGILRGIPVQLPPLPEQRAIAGALGNVDALLDALNQLIIKKRDLKQAAMQQLLTGNQRLPGFHGEWEVKRLGDVLKVRHGKSQQEVAARGGAYPILATGGEIGRTNHYIYDKPSVLIGRKGTIDAPQYVDTPFWTIDTLFFTEISPDASAKFIFYKFHAINWRSYNEASGVPSLNASTIEGIEVQVPKTDEQEAIAVVLSDMDAELTALEQRCDKTRALKQSMMQELLTGRTRLVSSNAGRLPEKEKRAVAKPSSHNWQINEAVVISVLARQFGTEKFPLGRKRYTKLAYLLHRHVEKEPEGYLKKAAGPYNPRTKYKGPEGIAQRNGYIRTHANGQYSGFVAADNIGKAEEYFQQWYGQSALQWLEQFRFFTNDQLELLATVDMAVRDLQKTRDEISLQRVKAIIRSHPEWEAKLTRPVFADPNITAAMKTCEELFD